MIHIRNHLRKTRKGSTKVRSHLRKRYKTRIEYLPGKKDFKYEVYLQDLKLGVSGTVYSLRTKKQAEKYLKMLKEEIKERQRKSHLTNKNSAPEFVYDYKLDEKTKKVVDEKTKELSHDMEINESILLNVLPESEASKFRRIFDATSISGDTVRVYDCGRVYYKSVAYRIYFYDAAEDGIVLVKDSIVEKRRIERHKERVERSRIFEEQRRKRKLEGKSW